MQLSDKDKRAIKLLAAFLVALAFFLGGDRFFSHWRQVRRRLAEVEGKMSLVNPNDPKYKAVASIVPVFEMPRGVEEQKFLFRDKLNEQFRRVGFNSEALKITEASRGRGGGYRTLRVECAGKCGFGQMLDLLANLNENPYLVGIEEFKIKCDQNAGSMVDLNMTVTTYAR